MVSQQFARCWDTTTFPTSARDRTDFGTPGFGTYGVGVVKSDFNLAQRDNLIRSVFGPARADVFVTKRAHFDELSSVLTLHGIYLDRDDYAKEATVNEDAEHLANCWDTTTDDERC